jgi:hypothetical protein
MAGLFTTPSFLHAAAKSVIPVTLLRNFQSLPG